MTASSNVPRSTGRSPPLKAGHVGAAQGELEQAPASDLGAERFTCENFLPESFLTKFVGLFIYIDNNPFTLNSSTDFFTHILSGQRWFG